MENVYVRVEGGFAVVEVARGSRSAVASALLRLVDDRSEVRTVTHVRGGLGFKVPARYRDAVHEALVAQVEEVEAVVEGDGADLNPGGSEFEAPPRNAGRDDWAAFLDAREVSYPEDSGRNDLIEIWDAREETNDVSADE